MNELTWGFAALVALWLLGDIAAELTKIRRIIEGNRRDTA